MAAATSDSTTPLSVATISNRSFELIKHFLGHHKNIENIDEYLEDIGRYLRLIAAVGVLAEEGRKGKSARSVQASASARVFTPQEKGGFRSFLEKLDSDPLRRLVIRAMDLLDTKLNRLEEKKNPFGVMLPDHIFWSQQSSMIRSLSSLSEITSQIATPSTPGRRVRFPNTYVPRPPIPIPAT